MSQLPLFFAFFPPLDTFIRLFPHAWCLLLPDNNVSPNPTPSWRQNEAHIIGMAREMVEDMDLAVLVRVRASMCYTLWSTFQSSDQILLIYVPPQAKTQPPMDWKMEVCTSDSRAMDRARTDLAFSEMNANLSERFRGLRSQTSYSSASTNVGNGLDLNLSLDIRNYFLKQKEIIESSKKDSWLAVPEIPTFEELSVDEMAVSVPTNKIDGPYKSKERYLKTQFNLLREDAIGPLRDAILDFQKDPTTMDTFKFSVYDQVCRGRSI